jgi:fructose-1,6-bisphosphatase/inositol monophosphatase family enzyme
MDIFPSTPTIEVNMSSFHPLHAEVSALLRQTAERIVMPRFRNLSSNDIEEKAPNDLVTIADKQSEEALSSGLAALLPDAAIIGEEAYAADPSVMAHIKDDQAWIIDPIDGTGNYARGETPFGIIIALAEQNETVAGWIYDPVRQRLCHAYRGHGAYIDGEQVKANQQRPERPKAALAMRYMTDAQRQRAQALVADDYELVPIPNCAAEQYPLLTAADHHFTIFERSLPWDHAAGVLFLNEAGGKVARWDGSAYRPGDDRKGLLGASNPQIWAEVTELFNHKL